ncbi:MAG TPA: dihydrodipicolinate synthase family protein, partial [Calditrichia bacterium]|nr:dihydrodipicolinate synthase family protein [Calditrichia bacterium]
FQILAGSAGVLLPALSVGAVGGILALANIAPQQCLDLFHHFQAGDLPAARDMQIRLIPVNTAVTAKWGVPGLKAALDLLGLYGGPPRAPLLPAGPDIRRQLSELMEIHLQKTGRNES